MSNGIPLGFSFRELWRETISDLRQNRLRSFLTMLGITWGVASLIILVAIGEGMRAAQEHKSRMLGQHIMIVWGGMTSIPGPGIIPGKRVLLHLRRLPGLEEAGLLAAAAQPRAGPRRPGQRQPLEPRQLRRPRRADGLRGNPHPGGRHRPDPPRGGHAGRRPGLPHRRGGGRPAVQGPGRPRREHRHPGAALPDRRRDEAEGPELQLQRAGQHQDLHPLPVDAAGLPAAREPAGRRRGRQLHRPAGVAGDERRRRGAGPRDPGAAQALRPAGRGRPAHLEHRHRIEDDGQALRLDEDLPRLRGGDHADAGRHRRHEHHAGVGAGAHPGDRPAQGDGRHPRATSR